MSTCKDCLHINVCKDYASYDKDSIISCDNFKNKADYAPVVFCVECKYKDDCARQMVHTTRDYVLEQNISTYNKVDYCSYGERKESEVKE